MAELGARLDALEAEMRLLKGEIKKTLVDIRTVVMKADGPMAENSALHAANVAVKAAQEARADAREAAARESEARREAAAAPAPQQPAPAAYTPPPQPQQNPAPWQAGPGMMPGFGAGGMPQYQPPQPPQPPTAPTLGPIQQQVQMPQFEAVARMREDAPIARPARLEPRPAEHHRDEEWAPPSPRQEKRAPEPRREERAPIASVAARKKSAAMTRPATAQRMAGAARNGSGNGAMADRSAAFAALLRGAGLNGSNGNKNGHRTQVALAGKAGWEEAMLAAREQLLDVAALPAMGQNVNFLANLVHWVSMAKRRLGEDKLMPFIDLYMTTGTAVYGLKEMVAHISAMIGDTPNGEERGAVGPHPTAQDWIDLMLQLHGIVMGSEVLSRLEETQEDGGDEDDR